MKKVLIAFTALFLSAGICFAGYVEGYTTKNGTYVAPHYRADYGTYPSGYRSSSYRKNTYAYYVPSKKTIRKLIKLTGYNNKAYKRNTQRYGRVRRGNYLYSY